MELVRLLTLCEVNLNLSDYDKRTLGHLAACEDHRELLVYLSKETDFDFTFKDRFGKSTLGEIEDLDFRTYIIHNIAVNKCQVSIRQKIRDALRKKFVEFKK